MIYTGYTLSQLLEMNNDAVHRLLATTDIVVDGPYLREQPETKRRWIGSANQRVHFLSDRHRADDACWKKPNTLELRLADGAITMNGFPAPQAKMLWQRVARS
jgi:anaerobic ribonucleoside-triphosphate reductase activating protein